MAGDKEGGAPGGTGAQTRARLLDAALDLVAQDGIQAVTHRAVEGRAGVARGSTRYHFGSRENLLEALVGHLAERDHEAVAQALGLSAGPAAEGRGTSSGDLAEVLADGFGRLAVLLAADRAGSLARYEVYLYAARRPELAEVVARWGATYVELGAGLLAQHAGADLDPEDAGRLAAIASAALDGIALHALLGPVDAERLGRELGALLAAATLAGSVGEPS